MTLLVNHQFTLDTLESLSSKTPDPVVAEGTESLPVEPLGLEDVSIHLVHLPPPPGPLPVDVPVLHVAQLTWIRRQTGKHVNCKLGIFIHLVQADSFVQLNLKLDFIIIFFLHFYSCSWPDSGWCKDPPPHPPTWLLVHHSGQTHRCPSSRSSAWDRWSCGQCRWWTPENIDIIGDSMILWWYSHLSIVSCLDPDLRNVTIIESLLRVGGVTPRHAKLMGWHDDRHFWN